MTILKTTKFNIIYLRKAILILLISHLYKFINKLNLFYTRYS